MKNTSIQYRKFNIEKRTEDPDSRKVEGYGAVFESPSEDLGFIETISSLAITEETIRNSDIYATLNHDPEKIFARSRYGEGSLELSVDKHGLHYRFDAPKTDLGDTLLEHLNRGEITSSSFAFTVAEDKWEKRDGKIYRTILKIDKLYDVSPVFEPAYQSAECYKRNKPSEYEEEIKNLEIREMEDEKDKVETPTEEPVIETPTEEPKEEPKDDENRSNGEQKEEDLEDPTDTSKSEEDSEERQNKNKEIHMEKVEKRFSLVAELRNAMETGKSIDLGAIENRGYSVTDEGTDVVETDLYNILEPLRTKNVLMQAGAKYMTGLVGNVQVPIMAAGNVAWSSELGSAADGSGSFTSVTLSPKRLTGKFPVSLQLLEQDSVDVENAIRKDIINAINDKLEETILKEGATVQGDFENLPASITAFKSGANVVSVAAYDDLVDAEAIVEGANVYGDCKYIVSPSAKAALRSMIKGTNGTGMVMEGGQVDGVQALSTGHVTADKAIYGDFSNVLVGSWGNVQLDVVRDVNSLANGCVTIVVNAFFDCKIARPEAFTYETI